ncbi:MAG TPA: response regulator transcription factor, partial [Burkholderiales bacterium]
MDTISILVVEDETEFLRAYCEAITREPDFRLMAAVSTLAAGMAVIGQSVPDVLVVDLGLPDGSGSELIRRAVQLRSDCDCLVVTVFGDDQHVIDAIAAGATGYILKDSPVGELAHCIRQMRAGGAPISPSIARRLLARMRAPADKPAAQSSPLSKREAEIFLTYTAPHGARLRTVRSGVPVLGHPYAQLRDRGSTRALVDLLARGPLRRHGR